MPILLNHYFAVMDLKLWWARMWLLTLMEVLLLAVIATKIAVMPPGY